MQPKTESTKPEKSSEQEGKPPKIPAAVIYRELADIINGESMARNRALPTKFHLVEPEAGKKQVLEQLSNGIVRYVDRQRVIDKLLTHIQTYFADKNKFALTVEQATSCIKYWMSITPAIETPKIVGQKDESGLFFHRLPFNLGEYQGPTPYFDDFFSRCTNADAIKAWIGSLFFPDSDRQQYVWIYGAGGDGKGALSHVLARVFGPSCCSPGVPEYGTDKRFWTYQLLGKRLVLFPECQNFSFVNSALFKQLTGGDLVNFEQKNKDAFSDIPACKFMFLSNERPLVNSARANERRLIYGEVEQPKGSVYDLLPSKVVEGAMWDEAPAFFSKCISLYEKVAPARGIISTNAEVFSNLADDNEENDQELFETYYAKGTKKDYVLARDLAQLFKNEKMSFQDERRFRDMVRRRYGAKPGRLGKKCTKVWFGIRRLTDSEYAARIIDLNNHSEE